MRPVPSWAGGALIPWCDHYNGLWPRARILFPSLMNDEKDQSARLFAVGALLLVGPNLYVSYRGGQGTGITDPAELMGYTTAPLLILLVVLVIARAVKSARSGAAVAKIAFVTLLVTLIANFGSLITARPKSASSLEITYVEPSWPVEAEEAEKLAARIETEVNAENLEGVMKMRDSDRFRRHVLARLSNPTSRDYSFAKGAANSFTQGGLFPFISNELKEGGEFAFVKFYERDKRPILQFRLADRGGALHYLDFYLFKDPVGNFSIDDMQYFNSGTVLSQQLAAMSGKINIDAKSLQVLKEVTAKSAAGENEAAAQLLEGLPPDVKKEAIVMRLQIQVSASLAPRSASLLLEEFKRRYPDDPSVLFSTYFTALGNDDLTAASTLIDDIEKAVDGDPYLVWYKANLLALDGHLSEACDALEKLPAKYDVDPAAEAEQYLVAELLNSDEYRAWLARH